MTKTHFLTFIKGAGFIILGALFLLLTGALEQVFGRFAIEACLAAALSIGFTALGGLVWYWGGL